MKLPASKLSCFVGAPLDELLDTDKLQLKLDNTIFRSHWFPATNQRFG